MPDLIAVLARVRDETRPTPEPAVDAALDRARARYAGIRSRNRRFARPSRGRLAVATGAAVLSAAAAITATTLALPHAGDSAAASVLGTAARAAATESAVMSPYEEVTVRENALGYASSDGTTYDQGYVIPTFTRTWVPRDRRAAWIRQTWSERPTTFFGGDAARAAAADDYAVDAHRDDPNVDRARGGDFTNGEIGGSPAGVLTPADFPALPRDPGRLAGAIAASPRDAGESDDEHVFQVAAGLLRTGVVPADLREAMFRVLAGLPALRITERQVALDGQEATAIGLSGTAGADRLEVLLDPATGKYLGERTIQTRTIGDIPAGTIIDSVSVTTRSVDTAP